MPNQQRSFGKEESKEEIVKRLLHKKNKLIWWPLDKEEERDAMHLRDE